MTWSFVPCPRDPSSQYDKVDTRCLWRISTKHGNRWNRFFCACRRGRCKAGWCPSWTDIWSSRSSTFYRSPWARGIRILPIIYIMYIMYVYIYIIYIYIYPITTAYAHMLERELPVHSHVWGDWSLQCHSHPPSAANTPGRDDAWSHHSVSFHTMAEQQQVQVRPRMTTFSTSFHSWIRLMSVQQSPSSICLSLQATLHSQQFQNYTLVI